MIRTLPDDDIPARPASELAGSLIRARDLKPGDVIRSNVAAHVSDGTPRTVVSVWVDDMVNTPGQFAEITVSGAPWPVDRVGAEYRFILVSRQA